MGVAVPRRDQGPDFIEALARGLDVIRSFGAGPTRRTLSEVAGATGLARPTARRVLLTLAELGYVRTTGKLHELTPRVLDLGMAYIGAQDLWELARPHLAALVAQTGESSSISRLDGSDIVYTARVAVPKIIALRVEIGTRFPAGVTSQGRVLLAHLPPERLTEVLATPSRSGVQPWAELSAGALRESLCRVHADGWALADNELAPGVRSIAVPLRDGEGRVLAAMNVTTHAAETEISTLTDVYLPLLLRTARAISADWALWQERPQSLQGGPDTAPRPLPSSL